MTSSFSPHYSSARQQDYRVSNPGCALARSTARLAQLAAALDAIREVARLDPDKARLANGVGFSVADVAVGHRLAQLTADQLRKDPVASGQALALAARYRRQVSPKLRYQMGLDDQGDMLR